MIGETQTERIERREAELKVARRDLADARMKAATGRYPFWAVVLVVALWCFSVGEIALHQSLAVTLLYALGGAVTFLLGLGMPRS